MLLFSSAANQRRAIEERFYKKRKSFGDIISAQQEDKKNFIWDSDARLQPQNL